MGDQQWLPGVVLAAAMGAGVSRLLGCRSPYHVFAERLLERLESRGVDQEAEGFSRPPTAGACEG
jgi:hypothetical protein